MEYFNAMWKYIAESGGPFILNESGVLASVSLTGFIKGKHYNRCKLIHMLFSAALQVLRLKEFVKLDEGNVTIDCLRDEIVNINKTPFDISGLSNDLKDFLDTYNNSAEATLKGLDGYTAQYWMGYIAMVSNWLQLSRSIREGDFALYVYCFKNISKYFFAFNQPNYARLLTEYHSKLLNIKNTHPDLEEEFRAGAFGIRRSNKNFARIPLMLVQQVRRLALIRLQIQFLRGSVGLNPT